MHQQRTLKSLMAAALVTTTMVGLCTLASAAGTGATLAFSYPNGFASVGGAIHLAGHSDYSGANINVTDGLSGHEAGGAWYTTPQNIQSFTTDFTFQQSPGVYGLFFVVQNSNSTTNSNGFYGTNACADANGEGYGAYSFQTGAAIGNSVGLKFDLTKFNGNAPGLPANASTTGVFVNGGPTNANFAPANDLLSLGIDLHSNHVMSAHVVYDGTLLTLVLKDTVTLAQARLSWPINIPAIVGANTAYVGFSAGLVSTVGLNSILSWDYYTGYNTRLAAPTFSVPVGSYASGQNVALSASPGAAIYYTTNGQPPTTASTLYTGPISVSSSEVIQAVAVQSGYTDSLVAVGNYQIAPTGSPIINLAAGFSGASNLVDLTGTANISGSALTLTNTSTSSEVGAGWYAAPVSIGTFSTSFTMLITSPGANGMAFVIQNPTAATKAGANSGGPFAIGNAAYELGYGGTDVGGGIASSIAVIFDLYNGSGDLTGLYVNGATPTGSSIDMSSSGVNLHSGNPLAVRLVYDGTTLTMTITDTKTKATFSKGWTINIPATVAGSTAYVGFTGATGGLISTQSVTSWTYSTVATQSSAVPAAPTNLKVQ